MRRSLRGLRKRYGRSESGPCTIPALDSLGEDGLMSFWAVYHRTGPTLAEHLFGKRFPGFTTVASSMAGYASNRATAMMCEKRGDASGAALYNSIAYGIARRLPPWVREITLPAQARDAILNHVAGEAYRTRRAILKGTGKR